MAKRRQNTQESFLIQCPSKVYQQLKNMEAKEVAQQRWCSSACSPRASRVDNDVAWRHSRALKVYCARWAHHQWGRFRLVSRPLTTYSEKPFSLFKYTEEIIRLSLEVVPRKTWNWVMIRRWTPKVLDSAKTLGNLGTLGISPHFWWIS